MPATPSQLFIGLQEEEATLKLVGRANFQLSVNFKIALNQIRERKLTRVTVLLDRCLIMDSTFIGVLAAYARELDAAQGALILMNPRPHIIDTLDNLGILSLFRISEEASPVEPSNLSRVASSEVNKEDLTRASLEAHETLIDINPKNASKFEDVTDFLRRELGDR